MIEGKMMLKKAFHHFVPIILSSFPVSGRCFIAKATQVWVQPKE